MHNPMVSIIIPVYNGSNYIREAIDSALAQDYDNFEVIIINDGSNDNGETESIVLSYGDKVRYFTKKNGGVASALNFGISHMRGEYFSWLSHDDFYMPDKLSVQIQALKKRGDMTSIVFGNYTIFNETSKKTSYHYIEKRFSLELLENSVFPVLQRLVGGCTLLIHKSHFERVGLFKESLITTQDYEMWFRMFRGQKLTFIPRFLCCTRLHPNQGTHTMKDIVWEEKQNLFWEYFTLLSKEEIGKIYESPTIAYHHFAGLFRSNGMMEKYKVIMERFVESCEADKAEESCKEFEKRLYKLYPDTTYICIFGCGEYGKKLWFDFTGRGIKIDYFADNNSRLWGNTIEGVLCISPEELYKIKDNTLIIVAASTSDEIMTQLQKWGNSHIITKFMIDELLIKTIPINV